MAEILYAQSVMRITVALIVPRIVLAGVKFRIISNIRNVETIASGSGVHIRKHLWRKYGFGHWRKMKGIAEVLYPNGRIWIAEIHWFEAHGIGRRMVKVKRDLREL